MIVIYVDFVKINLKVKFKYDKGSLKATCCMLKNLDQMEL